MEILEKHHGTLNGYKRLGCRCERCRRFHSEYQRGVRARNPERIAAYKRKHYVKHREQIREKRREYYAENSDKIRQSNHDNRDRIAARVRMSKYGLTPEAFSALLEQQGNVCAICYRGFGEQPPHVDHDHACCPTQKTCGGCIRGLLCKKCNAGIGQFGDDTARMRAAIGYLESRR